MRYNIALLPKHINQELIALSTAYKNHADYVLSTESKPHITLTQFYAPNEEVLEFIWKSVNEIRQRLLVTELTMQLGPLHYKIVEDRAWLELRTHYHPMCYKLHHELALVLQSYGLACLNAAFNQYSPHLTLVRTQDLSLVKQITTDKTHLKDIFYLALGKSDPIGQFLEIIKV